MKTTAIIASALLLTCTAGAQTTQPYGSAERARQSVHNHDQALKEPEIMLGYIQQGTPTLQTFLDNLEVGLTPAGYPTSKIISYTVTVRPHLSDALSSGTIKGSKLPRTIFNQLQMNTLKPGDIVMFENIRLELSHEAYRIMGPIQYKIM